MTNQDSNGKIIIYQSEDGTSKLDVKLEDETVWLTQAQLVELFQSSKANVNEHIKNIFDEGELEESSTVREFRIVRREGSRDVTLNIKHYNLDMIISLGYRIQSKVATHFPLWDRLFYSGAMPTMKDIQVAKNYLTEDELKILNNLVSGYFDFAEVQAIQHNPMHMSDYVDHLDRVLSVTGRPVLQSAGKISHQQAMDKCLNNEVSGHC